MYEKIIPPKQGLVNMHIKTCCTPPLRQFAQFITKFGNVGKEIMKIDLEETKPDIYHKLLNMWDENE